MLNANEYALCHLPVGASIENDEDAPSPWAVWLDGEILGSGDTKREAIAEALRTVRMWKLAQCG